MNAPANPTRNPALASALLLLALAPGLRAAPVAQTPAAPAPQKSPWSYTGSLNLKEGFDSNVFLQDQGDQAGKESWFTSITPGLGVIYEANPAFKASLSYAPEIVFFSSEPTEDHVAHRGALNLGGKSGNTAWELLNGITCIDGDDLGPFFTGGGDIPAVGGIPIRDRRDATIWRNGFKLTQTIDKFLVRPVLAYYDHDFGTELHRVTEPGFAGYENYIDRSEVAGGVDVGYEFFQKTWLVLGYRYGHQEQSKNQLDLSSPYSNDYQRFLAGIEGTPAEWIKLGVLVGPDVRDYSSSTPAGFDEDELLWFADASISFLASQKDTVILSAKRFLQPAFSSHSVYEDIQYDLSYRRKFDDRWSGGAGFKVYGGVWQPPVQREDWIFTPSALLSYAHDKHLSAELSYLYDWVDSQVPDTEGREYTRHVVALSLKYSI